MKQTLAATRPEKAALTRREPHQERAKNTVAKILAASHRILVEDGIDGLTTRKIASAAGISVGVLYQYFPSKQAVLYRIFDDRLQHALAVFDEAFADLCSPLEASLKRFFELHLEAGVLNRLDLELRNAVDRDPRLAEMTRHFESELSHRYVELLRSHGSTMSDAELHAMADYMHELDHINMKLQHHATREQRKMHAAMTTHIIYSLLTRGGVLHGNARPEVLS